MEIWVEWPGPGEEGWAERRRERKLTYIPDWTLESINHATRSTDAMDAQR